MKLLKFLGAAIVALFNNLTGKKGSGTIDLPSVAVTTAEIDHCIEIVNQVKAVVDSPVAVLVTDLIPGHIDDFIRVKATEALPELIAGLTFAKELLGKDINTSLTDLLAKIRLADDEDKNAFYHALAARLIMIVSDGKVSWSEAVGFLEAYFKGLFNSTLKAA